jgi:hypothetical protein
MVKFFSAKKVFPEILQNDNFSEILVKFFAQHPCLFAQKMKMKII